MRSALPASIALVLLGMIAACAKRDVRSPTRSSAIEEACPRVAPRACDGPPPTYVRDIVPILERRCFSCHAGDGPAADDHDFARFATFHAQRRAVADAIVACAMPPAPRPAIPANEADAILRWVSCGGIER